MNVPNTPQAWDGRADMDDSWEAAMWSERGQRVRHETVLELLRPRLVMGQSLLDFGCGTGSFRSRLPCVNYLGVDWSPRLLERARREHPTARFLGEVPVDSEFDHVVCIGPFNLADNWSHMKTYETLHDLWGRTRQSLIVSLFHQSERTLASSGFVRGMLTYGLDDAVWLAELLRPTGGLTVTTEHARNDMVIRFAREEGEGGSDEGGRAPAPLRHPMREHRSSDGTP